MSSDLKIIAPQLDVTIREQKILAYAPKPSSFLSLLCSIYLIIKIIRDNERRQKVFHRIILAMSVNTALYCCAIFCGTWAIAKEEYEQFYGASGTRQTCTLQGSLLLFGTSSVSSYHLYLLVFFSLSIRNGFNENFFRKYEKWIHAWIHAIPFALTSVALKMEFINPTPTLCFISEYPMGCLHGSIECLRGEAGLFVFSRVLIIFFFGNLTLGICCLSFIAVSIWKKEKNNERFVGKKKYIENARRNKSRMVSREAMHFFFSYTFTFFFSMVGRSIIFLSGHFYVQLFAIAPAMIGLYGVLHMFLYLWYHRRKTSDDSSSPTFQTKLHSSHPVTFEKRNSGRSMVGVGALDQNVSKTETETERRHSCPESFLYKPRTEFSIFDGTNPSETWRDFIIEDTDCTESEEPEGRIPHEHL